MTDWAFWGCLPFLVAALVTDIRSMRIPNRITVSAWLGGLLAQSLMNGWHGLLFSVIGAAAGFAVMLLLHLMGAVGAGDVKLFAGIGAWTGFIFTAQVIMYSILFGAVIGWIIALRRDEAWMRLRKVFGTVAGVVVLRNLGIAKSGGGYLLKFPFMLAVLPAVVCTYLYY
ncbi:A24 family peptidase [Paenibacillus agri]|uniref:Prepilin peptidase n=1 Tax=Paenibacillus agri TaxID=2744309 RepID=A0A850EKV8_9BACL|nr:A24 family peptidase [Paenibacillus agri]NUU60004.1 prepilin peptidase [Paenibacillus agri]